MAERWYEIIFNDVCGFQQHAPDALVPHPFSPAPVRSIMCAGTQELEREKADIVGRDYEVFDRGEVASWITNPEQQQAVVEDE